MNFGDLHDCGFSSTDQRLQQFRWRDEIQTILENTMTLVSLLINTNFLYLIPGLLPPPLLIHTLANKGPQAGRNSRIRNFDVESTQQRSACHQELKGMVDPRRHWPPQTSPIFLAPLESLHNLSHHQFPLSYLACTALPFHRFHKKHTIQGI